MSYSLTIKPPNLWLWRTIGRLAFNRISIIRKELLPSEGAILFVATHRNGALDAAAYSLVAPHAVPMLSAQLHRLPLGRILFRGITVARAKDKARGIEADNLKAMEQCVEVLKQGGQLFIMPEGTSSLGHKHLPFHRGAAAVARSAMESGVVPTIVPLGVHYEDPTIWQSRVEILVGDPIQPQPGDEAMLHRLISQGLEAVGANFLSEEAQCLAEKLAYACTLGTDASYAQKLKAFERHIPQDLINAAHDLEVIAHENTLWLHQGVPLVPVGPWPLYVAYWLLLAPIVIGFSLLNFPVLIAGYAASRKLPDAPNVISFWRMTVGLPVGLIWAAIVSFALGLMTAPIWLVLYWTTMLIGIMTWYRFRKLSIALCNGLFRANTRPRLLQAYRNLLAKVPHD
jgi:1-acyl-sn-glycerol-3-phosphate acyltransferase